MRGPRRRESSPGGDVPSRQMQPRKRRCLVHSSGLCEGEHRHEQKRRGDVKNQVPPAVQDPDVRFRRTRWNCRYGLRTGKGGNVLHRLERIESLNREKKSTSLSLSVTGPYVHGGVAVIQTKFRRDVIRESWHPVCSPAVRSTFLHPNLTIETSSVH